MPVAIFHLPLYQQDHFSELTGRSQWEVYRWLNASPEDHLALFRQMIPLTPFDMIQPHYAPSRQAREQVEYIEKDGRLFRHDRKEDTGSPSASSAAMPPITGPTKPRASTMRRISASRFASPMPEIS
ncbi:MAG: hypothetical protein IT210_25200 [Armatimonadetes bacterium]|nr:hypothetical protein [Armatimonadota bacterium]